MFHCQQCGRLTKPKEKSHTLVTERRTRTYTNKVTKDFTLRYITTTGSEIVKEVKVCQDCVDNPVFL